MARRKMEANDMPTMNIPLDNIYVDHDFNARKMVLVDGEYQYKDIDKFAKLLKRDGQWSAVGVRLLTEQEQTDLETDAEYKLVYGFRRFAAMELLEQPTIKAQLGGWETEQDELFANLKENVVRKDLNSYDKAVRYSDMKHELKLEGREIARQLGENAGHVNNLIRFIEIGDPRIVEEWRKGNLSTTTLKAVIKKDMTHEEQWTKLGTIAPQYKDDVSADIDAGGSNGNGARTGNKRPSKNHLGNALLALKESDKPQQWVDGAKAALKFALGTNSTLPGVYNPKKPPKAEAEA